MDLTQPCHHWLFKWYWDNVCKRGTLAHPGPPDKEWPSGGHFWHISTLTLGFNSFTDRQHMWSIFTMYWPQLAFYALIGRE